MVLHTKGTALGIKAGAERRVLALSPAPSAPQRALAAGHVPVVPGCPPPSSHPILVAVFGAKRVPSVPSSSAAGRGCGRGVHGRRDPKGLVTQDSVTGWRASGQQGQGEESRL